MKVQIIDSMMGTGKTSYAIQLMQEAPITQKFIYVTPFLDEVQRIKDSVTHREFREPDVKHGTGTKLQSLKRLIAKGEDIATTHSLFALADQELIDLLRWENYTLIVDEVMDIISTLQGIHKDDIKVLKDSGLIEIGDKHQVIWIADRNLNTKYNSVKEYALTGNLYTVNNTAFLWEFPAKIFDLFEQVYIMTYLFDGQLQRYYYDLHNIQYEFFAVIQDEDRYKLIPKAEYVEDRTHLKELIHIYEGKLNNIGKQNYSLSHSWFKNKHNGNKVTELKHNLYNFFRNIQKAKAEDILWTTFKDCKTKIHGKGFSKVEPKDNMEAKGQACFISFKLRATNRYRHKTVLAFCLNRYMNPIEEHFFHNNNVKVNEDLLALSDLLQWLFRSSIREGKPVNIYIPSKRMRELLIQWLNNDL